VSFAAVTLYVASPRVFIVISLSTQFRSFWIHLRTCSRESRPVITTRRMSIKFGTEVLH